MKIFSWFKRKPVELPRQEDSKRSPTSPPKNVKKIGLQYNTLPKPRKGTRYEDFRVPEYNIGLMAALRDLDGYVDQAFSKHEFKIIKPGYEFSGKNKETVDWVRNRLQEIATLTGIPTTQLLWDMAKQIVPYSNIIIIIVRDYDKVIGERYWDIRNKLMDPIAGIFVADATSFQIDRDENGIVYKYKQEIPGLKERKFHPDDIIHITYERKEGYAWGKPYAWAAIEDVQTLRKLEEYSERLVFQYLFPLLHYKIGTENRPTTINENGESPEVLNARQEINTMPSEGILITDYRHEIVSIGAKDKALDIAPYLKYWKNRVWADLGVSATDVGENDGVNRDTGQKMSDNMTDRVESFQLQMSIGFNEYIIKPLLLDGGFDITEENMVYLSFFTVDLDRQIKKEAHNIFKFQNNAITHRELRRLNGVEVYTEEDWKNSYWTLIDKPKLVIQAVDEPYSEEAKAQTMANANKANGAANEGKTSPDVDKNQSGKGKSAAETKVKPANQHGVKNSPKKTTKDGKTISLTDKLENANISDRKKEILSVLESDEIEDLLVKYFNLLKDDCSKIIKVEDSKITNDGTFKGVCKVTSSIMTKELVKYMDKAFNIGISDISYEMNKEDITTYNYNDYKQELFNKVSNTLKKTLEDVVKKAVKLTNNSKISDKKQVITSAFETLEYRIKNTPRTELIRAYNYGRVKGLFRAGIKETNTIPDNDNCSICKEKSKIKINTETCTLDDIAPYHTLCSCISGGNHGNNN